MKYGINTVLWVWPLTREWLEVLTKIKEMGFDTVEFAVNDLSSNNLSVIKNRVKDLGLECIVCGIFSIDGTILSADAMIKKKGREYILKMIDVCSFLGARILVGPTYSVGIHSEFVNPVEKRKAWERCVENLRVVGTYARDRGVRIAVEALNRYETNFLNSAGDAVRLVRDIDVESVGVHLDTYHMNIEEKNLEDAIVHTGKHLFHLHASENDRGTPGTGNIDWRGVMRGLRKISFREHVVIESCSPNVKNIAEAAAIWRTYDYDQDGIADRGLQFLRTLLH
jgi:D-psicose/D-tagatose/L-ribulose 3-epimerase